MSSVSLNDAAVIMGTDKGALFSWRNRFPALRTLGKLTGPRRSEVTLHELSILGLIVRLQRENRALAETVDTAFALGGVLDQILAGTGGRGTVWLVEGTSRTGLTKRRSSTDVHEAIAGLIGEGCTSLMVVNLTEYVEHVRIGYLAAAGGDEVRAELVRGLSDVPGKGQHLLARFDEMRMRLAKTERVQRKPDPEPIKLDFPATSERARADT